MNYVCPTCGLEDDIQSICTICVKRRVPDVYELSRAEAKALIDELMPTWVSSQQVKETLTRLIEFVK